MMLARDTTPAYPDDWLDQFMPVTDRQVRDAYRRGFRRGAWAGGLTMAVLIMVVTWWH